MIGDCKTPTEIKVGDRVRDRLNDCSGTVYDVFSCEGVDWAQVEWRQRGNQYSVTKTRCSARPLCDLVRR